MCSTLKKEKPWTILYTYPVLISFAASFAHVIAKEYVHAADTLYIIKPTYIVLEFVLICIAILAKLIERSVEKWSIQQLNIHLLAIGHFSKVMIGAALYGIEKLKEALHK